jgi:hypothetical protein
VRERARVWPEFDLGETRRKLAGEVPMSHADLPVPPALFPFFLAGLWLVGTGATALLGGWRYLAAHHRAPEGFEPSPEQRFRFRSIVLRRSFLFPARYNGCMTIGVTPRGLYLVPFVLIRFLHPSLLIPWTEISACEEDSFLWSRWVNVESKNGGPRIRLYGAVGDKVVAAWRQQRHGGFEHPAA